MTYLFPLPILSLNWRSLKSFFFIIFFSVSTHYCHKIFIKWIKSDVLWTEYVVWGLCGHWVSTQTMKLQRKHVNTKSNLLDVLGQALHNFHMALNVLRLLQQHPGRKPPIYLNFLHCPVYGGCDGYTWYIRWYPGVAMGISATHVTAVHDTASFREEVRLLTAGCLII